MQAVARLTEKVMKLTQKVIGQIVKDYLLSLWPEVQSRKTKYPEIQ